MKEIQLTKGEIVMLDDEDWFILSQFKWYYKSNGYACKCNNDYMHRLIMKAPDGIDVDHINGNRLDNRKENLRLVERKINLHNTPVRSHSNCNYKGVGMKTDGPRKRPYYARIRIDGKTISLGHFETEIEAAKAYDEAAKKYHGEYARTNF